MSHIFISYSRKDIDFAQKIVNALAENDLDTWIDWKSIPKGEDWEQEIYRGIEEADAFLFLISPDSVASQMCNKEIAHAVKNGKRILPIVIRDADPKCIHPEISKRNWIFCRDGRDVFHTAIEETQRTIHTNYEWLKYHTKLQVKAIDWERHKDHSRLIRGRELKEAEDLLAAVGGDEDPKPTDLQRNYLLNSRRNEERQRRQITFGLSLGLITVAILAVFAWAQRNVAVSETNGKATALVNEEHARVTAQAASTIAVEESNVRATAQAIAQKQSEIAIAQKLVFQSETLNSQQHALALLLSVQANQMNADLSTLSGMLNTLLEKPYGYKYLHFDPRDYAYGPAVRFSPQNQFVMAVIDDWRGTKQDVYVWDLISGTRVYTQNFPYYDGKTYVTAYHVGDNHLLLGTIDKKILDISLPAGKLEENMLDVVPLQFSPDGRSLIGTEEGGMVLWDIDTLTRTRLVTQFQTDNYRHASWVDSGRRIFFVNGSDDPGQERAIYELNLERNTIEKLLSFEENTYVDELAVSPDGKILAYRTSHSGSWQHETIFLDAETKQILWNISSRIRDLYFVDNSTILANQPSEFVYYDARSGRQLRTISVPSKNPNSGTSWFGDLFVGQDGRFAAYSLDDAFLILDLKNEPILGVLYPEKNPDRINGLAFASDGALVSVRADGRIVTTDAVEGVSSSIQISASDGAWHWPNAMDVNHHVAVTVVGGKELDIWDSLNGKLLAKLYLEKAYSIVDYAVSTNGILAIAYRASDGPDGVALYNLTGQKQGEFVVEQDDELYPYGTWLNALAFSQDGKHLAVAVYASVSIYDVEKGSFEIHTPILHTNDIMKVVYSPDGKVLATASSDGSIILWNAENGRQIGETLFSSDVITLAFSPHGQILASGDFSTGRVVLWDIQAGQMIGQPLRGLQERVDQLAFSPTGRYLAGGDSEGNIMIWDLDVEALAERVCSMANRNLTVIEWEKYIGGSIPYEPACPNLPISTQ